MADVVEEPFDVGVQYPVHRPVLDACRERVQRIMLPPSRPEPIGEAEEVRFVDGIVRTSTTARWTILSSSTAIPSGRCRPSGFGM
jgi:hypothetical protein